MLGMIFSRYLPVKKAKDIYLLWCQGIVAEAATAEVMALYMHAIIAMSSIPNEDLITGVCKPLMPAIDCAEKLWLFGFCILPHFGEGLYGNRPFNWLECTGFSIR